MPYYDYPDQTTGPSQHYIRKTLDDSYYCKSIQELIAISKKADQLKELTGFNLDQLITMFKKGCRIILSDK